MGTRRCLNCMKEFAFPDGQENMRFQCPICGHIEGTPPKEIYHLNPGVVLQGRYTIGTVVGFGGFGVIYRAWDQMLDTVVAIKEYYPSGLVQRVPGEKEVIIYEGNRRKEFYSELARFLDEAKNMARFQDNPNIVQVDNFFEENNTAYMVMEYLEGLSLKQYLKMENGKIDYETAVDIISSVIDALREIHASKILHRDISPDNIFLCEGGKVKLLDFGAARLSDEEKEITRSIILKPGFAPPEQYQSKSKQGPWTDIYALAATLYRSITGVVPDESTNRLEEDTVKAPMELDPSIPEYLSNTIMKGMALNPELRFRNVDEFKKALMQETKVLGLKEELKRRKKKRVITIAAAMGILLIGCIVAGSLYMKKYRETHLKSATVTVWISYGEEGSEADEQMIRDMAAGFEAEYASSDVHIQIEAFPEEEYMDKLEEAMEKGDMPTVYMSDSATDEMLEQAVPIKDIYKYIDVDNYYFLKEYKEELSDCRQMPMGFDVPVAYVRRGNNIDIETAEVENFEQIRGTDGHNYYISPSYYAMNLNSLGGEYSFQNEANLDQSAKDMLNTMSGDMAGKNQYKSDLQALNYFKEGKITYYLSSAQEFRTFNTEAAGLYEMRPLSTPEIYGEFTDMWSIDGNAGRDEIAAAKLLLSYMMDEGPQKTLHIKNKNAIPLQKDAYQEFIQNNGKYEIVNDYLDKLVFQPEQQGELKECSKRIAKEVVMKKDVDIDAWLEEQ